MNNESNSKFQLILEKNSTDDSIREELNCGRFYNGRIQRGLSRRVTLSVLHNINWIIRQIYGGMKGKEYLKKTNTVYYGYPLEIIPKTTSGKKNQFRESLQRNELKTLF